MSKQDQRHALALCFVVLALSFAACTENAATPTAGDTATLNSDSASVGDDASLSTVQQQPAAAAPPAVEPPRPQYVSVRVPAGTQIELELSDTVSSGTSVIGDPIRGRLAHDLYADGTLVATAGSELAGVVTDVVPLKKFGGQPSIAMVFNTITLTDGTTTALAVPYSAVGTKQAGRDAAKIGGGALAGAILGHQVDDDSGRAVGAVVGGAIGTAVAAKTGQEIELPAGTLLVSSLETDLSVRLRR